MYVLPVYTNTNQWSQNVCMCYINTIWCWSQNVCVIYKHHSVITECMCCVFFALFFFVLWHVSPMLPASLDCPFLIAHSVSLTFIIYKNQSVITKSMCYITNRWSQKICVILLIGDHKKYVILPIADHKMYVLYINTNRWSQHVRSIYKHQ